MFYMAAPVVVESMVEPDAFVVTHHFSINDIITGTLYLSEDNSRIFAHFDADYDGESYLIYIESYPTFEAAHATLAGISHMMEAVDNS